MGKNLDLSVNDIALYYSDLEHGVIGYNTADYPSDIVLPIKTFGCILLQTLGCY